MSLAPGARLGPYEVTAQIGVGGMGEVWRATDTNLGRQVAIKVLPDAFSEDRERLTRFEREAKTLASLNHPNIAIVHGLEKSQGTYALVMELVDGPTLADRIARGPIPVEDALPIAKQIAEALEAAHEQGIVHRDLKPANIKVRADGTVKVLDFGLAKAVSSDAASGVPAADYSHSPTITSPAMTQRGMILGTAAYMSPEQARGKPVDRRADIWAFGVVLWEMLTGRRAFEGDDVSVTLANVLKEEIKWDALPARLPPSVRRLLRRCMDRDLKRRLSAMGDAWLELEEAGSSRGEGLASPVVLAWWQRPTPVVLIALLTSAIASLVAWTPKPAHAVTNVVTRFSYPLPEGQALTQNLSHTLALSPDGTKLAYIANKQIYLRPLDELAAEPLRGSNEDPFDLTFSPDGKWIAYIAPAILGGTTGFSLKKIAVTGGAPVRLCATGWPAGVTWRDRTITFGESTGGKGTVQAIPEIGGTVRTLLSLDSPIGQPQLLDDGKHVLYTTVTVGGSWEDANIVVQALDGTAGKVVLRGAADGRVLPTGHLIYVHEGTLLAVPFDRARLEPVGGPVAMIQGIQTAVEPYSSGTGQFAWSETGTLAYLPRFDSARTLVWIDRDGVEEALAAPARPYRDPRLSPDGKRIAVVIDDQERDIWTLAVARPEPMRLTFGPAINDSPVWTLDGRSLLYSEADGTTMDIFQKAADNTGEVKRLTTTGTPKLPTAISRDGRLLVHTRWEARGAGDLFVMPLDAESQAKPLVKSKDIDHDGQLSPDGRWIAYFSNESGRPEVYVRPFPGVDGGKWQISADGGYPVWSRTGGELFYVANLAGDAKLMTVAPPPSSGGTLSWDKQVRVPLFGMRPYYWRPDLNRTFDVMPDGRRFLAMKSVAATKQPATVVVVSHWFDELGSRVPIGK